MRMCTASPDNRVCFAVFVLGYNLQDCLITKCKALQSPRNLRATRRCADAALSCFSTGKLSSTQSTPSSKLEDKMFGIAAAFALLGMNSLVVASGELKASPFMTATQIRDQFDDKDFVFDFNPLIDVDEIKENGG